MEIKNSYLMWIGSESYGNISEWANEAISQGISKRLPNIETGKALREEGTVIFVAHDEGEHVDCAHCQGPVECPDCRKRNQEALKLNAEIDSIESKYKGAEIPAGKRRSIRLRKERISKLASEAGECETCGGEGRTIQGAGGTATLHNGEVWDFRKYTYWRNQPKKWDFKKEVKELEMCPHCGGFGHTPDGKVFGVFVPEDVEYILSGSESEKVTEAISDMTKVDGAKLVREPKRKCGRRVPGGTYVVTSKEGNPEKARQLVETLVAKGDISPEAVELHGSFIRFLDPIGIVEKRFRGIKRWALNPDAEDAAGMALEGLE